MLLGVEEAETVSILTQMMVKKQKDMFMMESCIYTRIVLHRRLGECTLDMHAWDWYLRLRGEPNRAQVESRIDDVNPYDLEEWLKGS